jgi:hypothetical protein
MQHGRFAGRQCHASGSFQSLHPTRTYTRHQWAQVHLSGELIELLEYTAFTMSPAQRRIRGQGQGAVLKARTARIEERLSSGTTKGNTR